MSNCNYQKECYLYDSYCEEREVKLCLEYKRIHRVKLEKYRNERDIFEMIDGFDVGLIKFFKSKL